MFSDYLRFPNFVQNACCNPCCDDSVVAQQVDSVASENTVNVCCIPCIPCCQCGCGCGCQNVGSTSNNNCGCGNVGGASNNQCGCGCQNIGGANDNCSCQNVGGAEDYDCPCHHCRRRRRYW